ncbi:MAG: flavin reductase family protein, partial [Clostridia bacterium]|nr:flavin reductase family protein [Clostridia bacterium]
MSGFREISPEDLQGNVFEQIGRQWMLITAGDKAGFNTMTASWGG